MKDLNTLNEHRLFDKEHELYGTAGNDKNGIFRFRIKGKRYFVVASNGGGWEHVSVSPANGKEPPSWDVMCRIKDLFFEDEEVVVQYHPRKSEYVNLCESCLHLFRPIDVEMPTPHMDMI